MLLGVIGDPVAHSLSPLIHNRWIREEGLEARYVALQIASGKFDEALTTLRQEGFRGLNVTLPHKEAALAAAMTASMAAARIGAANTLIWRREGGWLADNTDAGGFSMTLDWDAIAVAGRPVILLGAGGSARAVAYTLAQRGARLTIANRTIQRAEQIVKRLAPEAQAVPLAVGLERLSEAELVINTLSLGHQGEALSLPAARGGLFYDISYGKAARPMLDEAARRNWRTRDGLGMLVAQAALSFELWFGIRPDTQGALQEVRRIVGVVG